MARKSASWSQLTFNTMSPARILLLVSVLANVALGATLAYMNSKEGDAFTYNLAAQHLCVRDYDWQQSKLADQSVKNDLSRLCGDTVLKNQ